MSDRLKIVKLANQLSDELRDWVDPHKALTAAQQRVRELEQENASLQDRLQDAQRCIAVMETETDQLKAQVDNGK